MSMQQFGEKPAPTGLASIAGLSSILREQILKGQISIGSLTTDEWAYSDGAESLCTLGASPCLNVVVHNTSTARGCLAHIRNHTLSQQKIYQTACQTIKLMIIQAQSSATDILDIWFGSGFAFYPGSSRAPQEPVSALFSAYLLQYLKQESIAVDKLRINETFLRKEARSIEEADAPDPGDILYIPALSQVILLSAPDKRFLTEEHAGLVHKARVLKAIQLVS